jgi:hypothetical protein
MVCKKNTCNLYWFGPRNILRPVGEESSVLSCTEVLIVGVTSERERGRSSQVSRRERRKWVCATLLVASQGLGELPARILRCVAVVVLFSVYLRLGCVSGFFSSPLGVIPACSFYSLKEVQGYMMLAYGVTLSRGLGRALSGGDMACTVEVWRRYFWYCCYVSRHRHHCWGSGFCPSEFVALRPIILGPVAGVACSSLWFDWHRGPRPRRWELRSDLTPIVGIVAQGDCSVHCIHVNRAYCASMGGIVVSSSFSCPLQSTAW